MIRRPLFSHELSSRREALMGFLSWLDGLLGPSTRPPPPGEIEMPSGLTIRLEPFEGDSGSGYAIVRNSDDQRLQWQTLKTGEGLKSFYVKGAKRRMDALQSSAFRPGKEVLLVPEPDNPHDEDAVAVYDAEGETKLGYVPADDTRIVHMFLDEDSEARCLVVWQVVEGGERKAIRVLLLADRTENGD